MRYQLRINRLNVTNFKGVKSFMLSPGSENELRVLGDNGTGKTTLFDAWCWLLFGKDSQGRAAFEVKALDTMGEPAHGLEHQVEAELQRGDATLTLRKSYKEKWTKRRGSAAKEFTGHTTDHFIDDVPVKQAEYQAAVDNLCPEEAFRMLTEPGYFAEQMSWQERRAVVLKVCGEVSQEAIIASNTDLADLADILGRRSVEEHRKVVQARRRKINEELERIPVRISEVQLGLPDVPEDESEVTERLVSLRSARKQAQEDHARLSAGGQVGELTNELRTVEGQLQARKTELRIELENTVGPKRRAVADAEDAVREATRQARSARSQLDDAVAEQARREVLVAGLEKRWSDLDATQPPESEVADACPTCGRKLAATKIKAAREQELADYNANKADLLAEIDQQRKTSADLLLDLKANVVSTLRPAVVDSDDAVVAADALVQTLTAELASSAAEGEPDLLGDETWSKLDVRKVQIQQRIEELKTEDVDTLQEVNERIAALDKTIGRDEIVAGRFEQHRTGKARMADLKKDERKLATEYEDLERALYLMDEFIKTKVVFLEGAINDRFKLARFKMFKVLVHGGLEECCEVTYKGVPYSSNLNHGARVQVGLDIVSTLQEHYGFVAPVWVDQSESITSLPVMDCQLVRLVVDEKYDKLTAVNTTK